MAACASASVDISTESEPARESPLMRSVITVETYRAALGEVLA